MSLIRYTYNLFSHDNNDDVDDNNVDDDHEDDDDDDAGNADLYSIITRTSLNQKAQNLSEKIKNTVL